MAERSDSTFLVSFISYRKGHHAQDSQSDVTLILGLRYLCSQYQYKQLNYTREEASNFTVTWLTADSIWHIQLLEV